MRHSFGPWPARLAGRSQPPARPPGACDHRRVGTSAGAIAYFSRASRLRPRGVEAIARVRRTRAPPAHRPTRGGRSRRGSQSGAGRAHTRSPRCVGRIEFILVMVRRVIEGAWPGGPSRRWTTCVSTPECPMNVEWSSSARPAVGPRCGPSARGRPPRCRSSRSDRLRVDRQLEVDRRSCTHEPEGTAIGRRQLSIE